MKSIRSQRRWRRVKRYAPLMVVALACIGVFRIVSGCGGDKPAWQRPLTLEGVPIVRVRVASQSSSQLQIACQGAYRLLVDNQVVDSGEGELASVSLRREGDAWRVGDNIYQGRSMRLEPLGAGLVAVGARPYRGALEFGQAGPGKIQAINHIDMESYLAGVLSKELYPSWQGEAYRALAVAARTFAMYHMMTFGEDHEYDLGSTQAAQVYGGEAAETERAWLAVRSTHGQVLAYGPPEAEKLFMAQYSACCGGRVNGADVIRTAPDIPPLRGGQECGDCSASSRHRWETVRITKAELLHAVAASYPAAADLKELATVRLVKKTSYGRIVWLDLVDPAGQSIRLRAEDVRLALLRSGLPAAKKLYSMNCELRDLGDEIEFAEGKGFGHGVGLCQWGAQGKASKGASGEEILECYYPRAAIVRAY